MLLARINGANPIEGERYYLRLLLNNVKGPTSFNGLWTMHGKRYCKCKEASQIRGLLESNGSLVDCLKETELLEMSYALRRLFATLLIFFKLGNYGIFFFFFFWSNDYNRSNDLSSKQQVQLVLKNLNYLMQFLGKILTQFDLLPIYKDVFGDDFILMTEIREIIHYSRWGRCFSINKTKMRNNDIIMERIDGNKSGLSLIDNQEELEKPFCIEHFQQ